MGTITAFTLAHSLTLAAATLGLVDVPQTPEVSTSQKDYPFINITADGGVFYNTEPVAYRDIPTRVMEDVEFNREKGERPGIFVRSHKTVPWEIIAPVVEVCGAQNIDVAMVTKPLEKNE